MSARILVVDDIAANVKILEAKLSAKYYTVLTAHSGVEGLRIATEQKPDLVLLDVMMPGMDGFEVCTRLKDNPATAHIPVVMVTALDQPSDRVRGLEVGADDFLTKPANDLALFARVRSLVRIKMMFDELRMRDETCRLLGVDEALLTAAHDKEARKEQALIVDGRKAAAESLADTLRKRLNVECAVASDRDEAMHLASRLHPDIFIIARDLDAYDGLRLCSEIRSDPEARHSAILLIAEHGDFRSVAEGLDLGASDYVVRPIDRNELVARVRSQMRQKRYAARLRANVHNSLRMAVTDQLTGLYNRRYGLSHLQSQFRRCMDSGSPLVVMVLDIDRFKEVNDRWGHAAGDEVIREFARRTSENVRGIDLVSRYGGEEFMVVMPDTDLAHAARIAERVRTAVARAPFLVDQGRLALPITVSIGVAGIQSDQDDTDQLFRRADRALYRSKHDGRNRVTMTVAA